MKPANVATLIRQGFNFGWTGVLAAVIHYGVLILLVERFAVRPTAAALAGYTLGGIASYLLNRRWTFTTDRPHREVLARFFVVAMIGFFMTGFSMQVLTERLHLLYLPAQILTTAIVVSWSFVAHLGWTFRPR